MDDKGGRCIMAKDLNVSNFDTEVAEGRVLVDFWASWCGPCRMMAPVVEQLDEDFGDLRVFKVNIDEEPTLAERYGVMSIPTLILFENGKEKARSVGLLPKEQLISRLGI
jgi:thioredoxin 1